MWKDTGITKEVLNVEGQRIEEQTKKGMENKARMRNKVSTILEGADSNDLEECMEVLRSATMGANIGGNSKSYVGEGNLIRGKGVIQHGTKMHGERTQDVEFRAGSDYPGPTISALGGQLRTWKKRAKNLVGGELSVQPQLRVACKRTVSSHVDDGRVLLVLKKSKGDEKIGGPRGTSKAATVAHPRCTP